MHRYDRWRARRYGAGHGRPPQGWFQPYDRPPHPYGYPPPRRRRWQPGPYDGPFHYAGPPARAGWDYARRTYFPHPDWLTRPGPWERRSAGRYNPYPFGMEYDDDDEFVDDDLEFDEDELEFTEDYEDLEEFDRVLDGMEEQEDTTLGARVRAALHRDGFLDAEGIQVAVQEAVVTLQGEVGDYMQARYAWDDAWEVPGVRGVISKLTVREMERQEAPADAARKAAPAPKGTSVSR